MAKNVLVVPGITAVWSRQPLCDQNAKVITAGSHIRNKRKLCLNTVSDLAMESWTGVLRKLHRAQQRNLQQSV